MWSDWENFVAKLIFQVTQEEWTLDIPILYNSTTIGQKLIKTACLDLKIGPQLNPKYANNAMHFVDF